MKIIIVFLFGTSLISCTSVEYKEDDFNHASSEMINVPQFKSNHARNKNAVGAAIIGVTLATTIGMLTEDNLTASKCSKECENLLKSSIDNRIQNK